MGFNVNKLKVNLKLSINRIKLLQSKKEAIKQNSKREIAELLKQKKIESAKIKVENILREDSIREAMEFLDIYCELLLARIGKCDDSILEAVHTLIYASIRSEVKELIQVKESLGSKFGKDFVEAAMTDSQGLVNPKVVHKFKVNIPDPMVVHLFLKNISKDFNVDFDEPEPTKQQGSIEYVEASKLNPAPLYSTPSSSSNSASKNASEYKFFNASSATVASAPPAPVLSNIGLDAPKIPDLPTSPESQISPEIKEEPPENSKQDLPDFDELAKRFEELKRHK